MTSAEICWGFIPYIQTTSHPFGIPRPPRNCLPHLLRIRFYKFFRRVLDKLFNSRNIPVAMAPDADSPFDLLWNEYSLAFREFDDLTLARWMAQTLGQLEGKAWRLTHPLLGAYRLAAQLAHERQIWLKRLATPPAAYADSPCCRAPMLPLL